MKKIMALVLAAMMLLAACGALAEYPAKVEGIDFGGAEVQILDYWSGDGARAENPTEEQQAQYDYRDWINETYNVNVHQLQGGDWGTCAEEMINFTANPDGSLRMYIIEPGKVGSLVANGYAAAIPETYVAESDWNAAEKEFMTVGGKLYGLYKGNSEPRGCLYFNKRVLKDAGIEWEELYTLQAEGKWTWAKLEELCAKLTRDTDNDGVYDVYGLIGSTATTTSIPNTTCCTRHSTTYPTRRPSWSTSTRRKSRRIRSGSGTASWTRPTIRSWPTLTVTICGRISRA